MEKEIAKAGTAPFEIRIFFLWSDVVAAHRRVDRGAVHATQGFGCHRVAYFSGAAPPLSQVWSTRQNEDVRSTVVLATWRREAVPFFSGGGRTLQSGRNIVGPGCLPDLVAGVFNRDGRGTRRISGVRAVRDVTAAMLRVYADKISWTTGVRKHANAPSENYFDRKHRFSVIAQVVVDVDVRVLDVFVGYTGSCHDIRVMQLSSLSRRAEEGLLFRGPLVTLPGGVRTNGYILGDNGYPPSEWVIVSYGGINQHPDEKRFNTKQKVARGAVERAFGRLKGMWRLFLRTHKTNLDSLPQQFTTVCILHNILLDAGIEFDENLLWEVDADGVRRPVDLGIDRPPQPVSMLTSTREAHSLRNALAERMKHM
ncbi:hypothetical protein CBR_g42051 [Chara braunii]|uniref:DDE Tnp4 domain-containing protein n=1 Tax=Chara braunii TaxID=69332 RepID=A0A388LWR5_CHABU|nr:hypothetical protein CBR_g42051 [Chara braunii]|eukprot:GBG86767.1 hypothetical protein CBR_g42051 [Chara braunii]